MRRRRRRRRRRRSDGRAQNERAREKFFREEEEGGGTEKKSVLSSSPPREEDDEAKRTSSTLRNTTYHARIYRVRDRSSRVHFVTPVACRADLLLLDVPSLTPCEFSKGRTADRTEETFPIQSDLARSDQSIEERHFRIRESRVALNSTPTSLVNAPEIFQPQNEVGHGVNFIRNPPIHVICRS